MADNSDDLEGLEAFFAAGRSTAPEVSDALMARILGDAAEEQARILAGRAAQPSATPAARPRPWQVLIAALGGGKAVAGLVTAALVGIWLGISPPTQLAALTQTVTQNVLGSSTSLDGLDLLPTLDPVLTQG